MSDVLLLFLYFFTSSLSYRSFLSFLIGTKHSKITYISNAKSSILSKLVLFLTPADSTNSLKSIEPSPFLSNTANTLLEESINDYNEKWQIQWHTWLQHHLAHRIPWHYCRIVRIWFCSSCLMELHVWIPIAKKIRFIVRIFSTIFYYLLCIVLEFLNKRKRLKL